MPDKPTPDGGSFRDPCGKIYRGAAGEVYRATDQKTTDTLNTLLAQPFHQKWRATDDIIATDPADITIDDWHGVFRHPPLPFISYPYEWPFSMLRDAALLQLRLQQEALENGWTFKDATPYNIQWRGTRPVFIDTASLIPAAPGAPWSAHRQFCTLYLYPLLIAAHRGISHTGILRAHLDGLSAQQAARYFPGLQRFKKGVPAHILFPAAVQRRLAAAPPKPPKTPPTAHRPQSPTTQFGLLHGLRQTLLALRPPAASTEWSDYATQHSYSPSDYEAKKQFVQQIAAARPRRLVWDLGANTGDFALLCTPHADHVVAADGDEQAIERLYLKQRKKAKNTADNLIPLIQNVANFSPAQGFAGQERRAFDHREPPQLILCLALVHHLRISANIPMPLFLDWLRATDAEAIVEYVDRDDNMTQRLLQNKQESYPDYNRTAFRAQLLARFTIAAEKPLKQGTRILYHLTPGA